MTPNRARFRLLNLSAKKQSNLWCLFQFVSEKLEALGVEVCGSDCY
jgi:hypothetical protein